MKTWAEVADELGADKTAMAKWVWAREAVEEIERLRARNKRLEEQLTSCIIQIEYMHRKFKPTGSGEATIVQARAALED